MFGVSGAIATVLHVHEARKLKPAALAEQTTKFDADWSAVLLAGEKRVADARQAVVCSPDA